VDVGSVDDAGFSLVQRRDSTTHFSMEKRDQKIENKLKTKLSIANYSCPLG
jgi:hypothetical protein